MNELRIVAAVAAVGLAGVILYRVSTDQPKPQFAPPSSELMSRSITTCDQLQQEIVDMTQTTAEIRKVLVDLARLTCEPIPKVPNETFIPDIPRCGPDGTAVMVAVGSTGVPGWECRPK